jgi:hypothetical protein
MYVRMEMSQLELGAAMHDRKRKERLRFSMHADINTWWIYMAASAKNKAVQLIGHKKRRNKKKGIWVYDWWWLFRTTNVITWWEYEIDNERTKIWHEIKRILVKQELKSLTMILETIFKLFFQSRLKLKLFFWELYKTSFELHFFKKK